MSSQYGPVERDLGNCYLSLGSHKSVGFLNLHMSERVASLDHGTLKQRAFSSFDA